MQNESAVQVKQTRHPWRHPWRHPFGKSPKQQYNFALTGSFA